jgi:hypothetical protein
VSPASSPAVLLVIGLVWVSAAVVTGMILALLARRIHPSLSLGRLWVFYTLLMGFLVAFVMVLGWY